MNASIIFTPGNHPQPNEQNILFNLGDGPATLVQGSTNQTGTVVNFTSSQTIVAPSNGQARVSGSPDGTPLTNLTIALASGLTYGDLIINPFIGGQCKSCTPGNSTITVNSVTSTGVVEAPSLFTLPIDNGQNFLTITTSGGEAITRTTINAPGGISDLRQPRISGPFNPVGTSAVPEPSTSALLGGGLVGLSLLAKKLRTRRGADGLLDVRSARGPAD